MSKIKLEVGKTYRNRKGEDVKIVKTRDSEIWPFHGDNGESYNEHGKYYSASSDDPRDLIEEVTNTRHAFAIPDDMKKVTVEQVGNKIVVEMVPEEKEPKPGDVMINDWGGVYIFKSDRHNEGSHNCFAWLGESGKLLIGGWCTPGRPATPEEAQPLWDALKKAGKRWNAETMQVEDVPESTRIREWVWANLESDFYDKSQIAKAIEAYLKYREGEK